MSYAIPCTKCGEMFTKFSNRSYESKCLNCRGARSRGMGKNIHKQRDVRKMKAEKTIQERMNELQDAIDIIRTEVELINADIEAGMNERNTIAGDIETKAMESLKAAVVKALEEMLEEKTFTKNIAMLNTRILKQRDKQEKESERIRKHLNELCDIIGYKRLKNYDPKTGGQLPEPDATGGPDPELQAQCEHEWRKATIPVKVERDGSDAGLPPDGTKEIWVCEGCDLMVDENPTPTIKEVKVTVLPSEDQPKTRWLQHILGARPLTLKEAKEQPKEEPTTEVIIHTTEEDAVLETAEEIKARYGGIGKHWTRAGSEHKVPMEGRKCTRCGTTKTRQWRYVGLQHSFAPLCNKCGNIQRRDEGKDTESIERSKLKQKAKARAKQKAKGRKQHCCTRCGRADHNIRRCYARRHIKTKERLDPTTARGLSPSQKKRQKRKTIHKVESEQIEADRIASKKSQDEARIKMAYTYMKEDGMLLSMRDLMEFWILTSNSVAKRLVDEGIKTGRFVIKGKRGTKGRPMTLYGAAERNEHGDGTE